MNANSFMHFQVGPEVVQGGPDLVQGGPLLVQGGPLLVQPKVSSTVKASLVDIDAQVGMKGVYFRASSLSY